MNVQLHEYLRDRAQAERLALACNTKPVYLSHIALGHRKASHKLAQLIHEHSGGQVPKESLRPDIWPADKPTNVSPGGLSESRAA